MNGDRDTLPDGASLYDTYRRKPTGQERYEAGLRRTILAIAAILALGAIALILTSCAAPQLPRNEAERMRYCARIAQARSGAANWAEDDFMAAGLAMQLDEQAEAGGCP